MELKTYLQTKGRAQRLAAQLGVRSVMVSQWKLGVKPVPADRCPAIERFTDGAVRCEEMRPDIDWAVLRNSDCKEAA